MDEVEGDCGTLIVQDVRPQRSIGVVDMFEKKDGVVRGRGCHSVIMLFCIGVKHDEVGAETVLYAP